MKQLHLKKKGKGVAGDHDNFVISDNIQYSSLPIWQLLLRLPKICIKSELGIKIVYTIEDVFIEKQLLLHYECVLFSLSFLGHMQ
jgi:hypothetical protein